VRQNFRLNDLLGMVLGVTGKHPERVRQILRSGSISFHSHRYWWEGFHVEERELTVLLARFPDADPSRGFRSESCTAALVEEIPAGPRHAATGARPLLEFDRAGASRKRLFHRRSLWDALLAATSSGPISYDGYSYGRRADLYRLELSAEQAAALAEAAKSLAPRDLRRSLPLLARASRIVFVCPREES
jgi:hypothetical protein